jgi:hypothetical protein
VALPRLTVAAIALAWTVTVGATVNTFLVPVPHFPAFVPAGHNLLDFYSTDAVGLFLPYPYVFAVELVCGLIALASALVVEWRLSRLERVALGVAVASAVAVGVLVGGFGHTEVAPVVVRDPVWMNLVRLVPFALLVAGLVAVVRRRSTMLLWSGLLLLVPYPAMVPWSTTVVPEFRQVDPLHRFVTQGPWALVPESAGTLFLGEWRAMGCILLGAIAIATVYLADAYRRAPRPRDGRVALSALSGVALGVLAGSCAYILLDTGIQTVRSPIQGVPPTLTVIVPLGFTVVAALATPFLPWWLRAPMILAATVWLFTVPASTTGDYHRLAEIGPHYFLVQTVLTDAFRINLVLLVLVALADLRVRGWTVVISTVATLAMGIWLNWMNEREIWAFATATWQLTIMSALTAVVLVLALWWAPVVIVSADRGWAGALLALAAGLLWIGLQLQLIVHDHAALAVSLSVVGLAVLAGRVFGSDRDRLDAAGTA